MRLDGGKTLSRETLSRETLSRETLSRETLSRSRTKHFDFKVWLSNDANLNKEEDIDLAYDTFRHSELNAEYMSTRDDLVIQVDSMVGIAFLPRIKQYCNCHIVVLS